ncbi:Spo0E family sporulation regulatory protein-aspartic acid phosphatase [Peribacillus muralis]|uniref:Spo0E family sporulation regulatory protein-aspartic acid phosphatase n=1 Tax=Peribacillus muralis TaxID=264697 RepID=UPI0036735863
MSHKYYKITHFYFWKIVDFNYEFHYDEKCKNIEYMGGGYKMLSRKVTPEKIEEKRKEMIELAEVFGINSLLTIQASQELDILLNTLTKSKEKEYFSVQKKYKYF